MEEFLRIVFLPHPASLRTVAMPSVLWTILEGLYVSVKMDCFPLIVFKIANVTGERSFARSITSVHVSMERRMDNARKNATEDVAEIAHAFLMKTIERNVFACMAAKTDDAMKTHVIAGRTRFASRQVVKSNASAQIFNHPVPKTRVQTTIAMRRASVWWRMGRLNVCVKGEAEPTQPAQVPAVRVNAMAVESVLLLAVKQSVYAYMRQKLRILTTHLVIVLAKMWNVDQMENVSRPTPGTQPAFARMRSIPTTQCVVTEIPALPKLAGIMRSVSVTMVCQYVYVRVVKAGRHSVRTGFSVVLSTRRRVGRRENVLLGIYNPFVCVKPDQESFHSVERSRDQDHNQDV